MQQLTITMIKYFCIIFCSHYIFTCILNIKSKALHIISNIVFSLLITIPVHFIRDSNLPVLFNPLSIFLMVGLSWLFCFVTYKKRVTTTITAIIISYGMSYIFLALSSLLASAIVFYTLTPYYEYADLFSCFLAGVLQVFLSFLVFRIKRFKSGWRFLEQKAYDDTGLVLSVSILLACSLFSNEATTDYLFLIPVFFAVLCGLLVFFWGRKRITGNYIERLRQSELSMFEATLKEKDRYIKELKEDNDNLSKIIHKDNKLIPALEFAVKNYISANTQNSEDGKRMLEFINRVSSERKGVLYDYELKPSPLPSTKSVAIDTILNFMAEKASNNHIDFNVSVNGEIDKSINESDLETLLADLIENAIIATKKSDKKLILANIGVVDNIFSIDIFDSGVNFELETIEKIGKEKTTTHKDEGGSGIGLMTAIEIADRYSGSFIIEEFNFENSPFSKKVSIRFDSKKNHLFISNRALEIDNKDSRLKIVYC